MVSAEESGRTTFSAELTGPAVNTDNNFALWVREAAGALREVARTGDPAPGTVAGTAFSYFEFGFQSNSQNEIAFVAPLRGIDVTSSNDAGIWLENQAGSLVKVLQKGDPFIASPNDLVTSLAISGLSDCGTILGSAASSAGSKVLWTKVRNGDLEIVATTGEPAPEVNGAVFSSFPDSMISSTDQMLFFAMLDGVGIDSSNDKGLWKTDKQGVATLIAREGDLIEFSPGVFRTIQNITIDPMSYLVAQSPISRSGNAALLLRFTDGSDGFFALDIHGVPEPTAFLLFVLAGGAVLSLRRSPMSSMASI